MHSSVWVYHAISSLPCTPKSKNNATLCNRNAMQSQRRTPAHLALFPAHDVSGLLVQVLGAFFLDDGQCVCCEHAHGLLLPFRLTRLAISVPAVVVTVTIIVTVSSVSVITARAAA